MRPNRYLLMLSTIGITFVGAWWFAHGQDVRTPWGPPTVVPADEPKAKPAEPKKGALATYPRIPAKTAKTPAKSATPPRPNTYDPPPPAPVPSPSDEGVRQAAGQIPLPPMLQPVDPPAIPPPSPPMPMPLPLPTLPKVEPTAPTTGVAGPILETKPLILEPGNKKSAPPEPKRKTSDFNDTKTTAPLEPKREVPAPKTALPLVEPKREPLAMPTLEPKPSPPVVVMPSPVPIHPEPKAPAPLMIETKPAPSGNELRAFVPIRPVSRPIEKPAAPPPAPTVWPVAKPAPAAPAPKTQTGALTSGQIPALVVEKRGPATQRAGEKLTFQIHVRNLSPFAAHHVRVEDEIPPGANVIAADPVPAIHAGKAVWSLPTVGPQSELTLQVSLQMGLATEFTHRVSVFASSSEAAVQPPAPTPRPAETNVALRPRLQADTIGVRLTGVSQVVVGKPVLFDIHVTNQSSQPQSGLVIYGYLPDGLSHPEGPNIKGPFDGVLQPGETRTLRLPATAVKPGRYTVGVKITAAGGVEASTTASLAIESDSLHVQQAMATRFYVGREGDCRIELTNHTGKVMRNLAVINELPEGLEFVAASNHGLYQANRRGVYWMVDQLLPGQSQTLMVRLHATKPGQYSHAVSAKADGTPETKSVGMIQVEGVSGLSLKVIDRDNPLELGRETVYEVKVANPGTTPSTNVKLHVLFPPGLTPRNAQGDTRHMVEGQTIVFAPLPALGPQGEAIFRVSAVAQSIGDQRVRFAVVSDQSPTPITREKGTWVYRD